MIGVWERRPPETNQFRPCPSLRSTRQPRFQALFLPERPSRRGATRNVLDRSGRAEEVALATLFLASDSSFWVTDVTLDVAGAGSWTAGCLVRGSER